MQSVQDDSPNRVSSKKGSGAGVSKTRRVTSRVNLSSTERTQLQHMAETAASQDGGQQTSNSSFSSNEGSLFMPPDMVNGGPVGPIPASMSSPRAMEAPMMSFAGSSFTYQTDETTPSPSPNNTSMGAGSFPNSWAVAPPQPQLQHANSAPNHRPQP